MESQLKFRFFLLWKSVANFIYKVITCIYFSYGSFVQSDIAVETICFTIFHWCFPNIYSISSGFLLSIIYDSWMVSFEVEGLGLELG